MAKNFNHYFESVVNKRKKIYTEEMDVDEAYSIFKKYGISNPENMDRSTLKKEYNNLIKKYHPDINDDYFGNEIKEINAAYDVISGQEERRFDARYSEDRRSRKEPPVWLMSTWSGGMKPTYMGHENRIGSMEWVLKKCREYGGKNTDEKYTFWHFDGAFVRDSLTVYGADHAIKPMAKAFGLWAYDFREGKSVILMTKNSDPEGKAYLVYANYLYRVIPFEYDSFNKNPGNDKNIRRKIEEVIGLMK